MDAFKPKNHQTLFETHLASAITRLSWSCEQIKAYRTDTLRRLLHHCKTHSPWYRDRLRHVDIDCIEADNLSQIPPMTKSDMLEHWDDIVTDRRISYQNASDFLKQHPYEEQLFLDQYHVWASGGSSGKRGLYIWSEDDFAEFAANVFRYRLMETGRPNQGVVRVIIQPNKSVHITPTLYSTGVYPNEQLHLIPANTPITQIIAKLNALAPTHLEGYPSIVALCAEAALNGSLSINPICVGTNSEVMTRAMYDDIKKAWPNAAIYNHYGSTDSGTHGMSCGFSRDLHLNWDVNIVEPVDSHSNAVAYDEKSEALLTTCLYNWTFPLLRYELTDCICCIDPVCQCGCAFPAIKAVDGRLDDNFIFSDVVIRPNSVFNSIIVNSDNVADFQMCQQASGVSVDILAYGTVDVQLLQDKIKSALIEQGVAHPVVDIRIVDKLKRHPETDKLKRYVPMKEG